MEGESTQNEAVDRDKLELIVGRLRELTRKHLDRSLQENELSTIQGLLDEVISTLESGLAADPSAIDFSGLARQVATVELIFERSGLVNVAKIVNSVEKSLRALHAPQQQTVTVPPPPRRFEPPPQALSGHQELPELRAELRTEPADALSLPLLLLYGACGLCLAWVVSRRVLILDPTPAALAALLCGLLPGALLSRWHRHLAPLRTGGASGLLFLALLAVPWCVGGMASAVLIAGGHSAPAPQVMATPVPLPAAPSPTPVPTAVVALVPSQAPAARDDSEEEAARLQAEVELTRAALADGNLERAKKHLALATMIDPYHRLVSETAETFVEVLLDRAEDAADEGDWDMADDQISEARILAARFYLDIKKINETARRLDAMIRFTDVTPDNQAAIRAAIGRPVRITLTSYDTVRGRLKGFDGTTLTLEIRSGIGGGQARFSKIIPLSSVRELRLFER